MHKSDLVASINGAANSGRPTLTHLNADTTWLLQLPYTNKDARPRGRSSFNILIDPWLRGRQSDVAFWFSSQWHVIRSSVETLDQLNEILRICETHNSEDDTVGYSNFIDAVVVSHEFTDHCHKATLLELDPAVPVFATRKAADLIRSWRHFDQVIEPRPFSSENADWRKSSHESLPSWVGISRMITQNDALYYHSAIMIAFCLEQQLSAQINAGEQATEAVIYTPHGIHASDLACLKLARPSLSTLALMHGLHDVRVSTKQLNLGAHNGLQAQRICHARYWVSTHDEVKKARGFISPILFRKKWTLKHALEEEKKRSSGDSLQRNVLATMENVHFSELQSGQSIVLQ